jgi:tetratricopeptide (TPR) repeat protein
MDCRRSVSFALTLLAGAAGCSHNTTPQQSAPPPAVASTSQKADAIDPEALKRPPKPETFVAFGDFSAREAEGAQSPAEKEQLSDRARRAYQEALKLDPSSVTALKALARLYAVTNDYARAKEGYENALKIAPTDAGLWFDLGMTYARTKEWGLAIEHVAKAVELEPENRSYARYLGFTLARAGRYDESLAAFSRYEGAAKAHYYVAEMLEHMHQPELCKTHLQLALASDPQLHSAAQMLVRLNGLSTAPVATAPMANASGIQLAGWTDVAQPKTVAPARPTMLLPPPPLDPADLLAPASIK